MREHDRLEDLAMNELSVRAQHFMKLADDSYHDSSQSNSWQCSHYLLVAERYFNEIKIRAIMTAI